MYRKRVDLAFVEAVEVTGRLRENKDCECQVDSGRPSQPSYLRYLILFKHWRDGRQLLLPLVAIAKSACSGMSREGPSRLPPPAFRLPPPASCLPPSAFRRCIAAVCSQLTYVPEIRHLYVRHLRNLTVSLSLPASTFRAFHSSFHSSP